MRERSCVERTPSKKNTLAVRNTRKAPPTPPSTPFISSSYDWGWVRLWSVGVFFSVLLVSLWARAYYLQIVMGPEYAAKARRQHTATEQIKGIRGNIVDRSGNVLARSVEGHSVWANPSQITDPKVAGLALSKTLGMPVSRITSLLTREKRFVWLSRKVDYQTAEAVKDLKLAGVYLDTEYERVYPYRQLAGQLLGFVDIDDKGIEGLEKAFDDDLTGRKTTRLVERDASGRRFVAQGPGGIDDLRGRDLRLTLDAQVQFFAEEALVDYVDKFAARWGGCIVVDVPTGDILAWAQYPFFDPNNISATTAADRRNRLAMDALEQGSTIKSFLIAAALEEKIAAPDTQIDCEKGVWRLGKVTLHDTHPYATLRLDKILHVSSNIGVAKIGLRLGAGRYHEYLRRLGFGRPTDLPLASEAKGILRPPGRWSEIDVAAASFGQSFSATMAQMAQAYLCLASDGVKKPMRLVIEKDTDEDTGRSFGPPKPGEFGDRVFSEETMLQVRAMLREVVEEDGGTGRHARIPGLVVGGKTGTAQKADATGRYGKGRVGSFVGMIPTEQPRYLILALLDEPATVPYGGVIAAPVFRHVALNTMAYHGLLPEADDPLIQEASRKQVARSQGGVASSTLSASVTPIPQQAVPVSPAVAMAEQSHGSAAPSRHTLSAQPAYSGRVPLVVGMTVRRAVEQFASRGVVPLIKGSGSHVVRQKPEPGAPWAETSAECTLWLEDSQS